MTFLQHASLAVTIAICIAVMIFACTVFIVYCHDRKHEELDQWVEFAFSRDSLRHVLKYYRGVAAPMLFIYVFFTCSLLMLQADGHALFADGLQQPVRAGPLSICFFALDLVLRGSFFDFMQHFDLHVSTLNMNRKLPSFVWYAFLFRMFYGLTMIKILLSFVWIYGKIRLARQAQRGAFDALRLPN